MQLKHKLAEIYRQSLRSLEAAIAAVLLRWQQLSAGCIRLWRISTPVVAERADAYAVLMRWNRPRGILLLLWPVLWALWIAGEGRPEPLVLIVFVTGVFVMRSAGCIINDVADRRIDPHVTRTRERPLATGRVSMPEALVLFGLLCLIGFGLVLLMNPLTIMLAFAGLGLLVLYPFSKRFTHMPQAFLGAAFGWAVPMAFAAQTGTLVPLAWLLFFIVLLWAIVYDTMYAMVDRDDDLKIGVKSSAILFGELDRHMIGIVQVMMLAGLVLVGQQAELGVWYYGGLAVGAGLFVWHQVLIHGRSREGCFQAFLHNNWFGLAVFCGLLLDYIYAVP